jgi:hypothetical protein
MFERFTDHGRRAQEEARTLRHKIGHEHDLPALCISHCLGLNK